MPKTVSQLKASQNFQTHQNWPSGTERGAMRKPKRILVGLKTLENAAEPTTLACHLGSRGASLILVHVIELPDNTALDAEVPDLEAAA